MSLVVTLKLDADSQGYFEGLRQLHFPAHLNKIPAHLTLFHQLPEGDAVVESLTEAAWGQDRIDLRVTGLRSLGRGVAFTLQSPALLELHRKLSARFEDELIPQDRQRFMPHVVVQNKATAEQARDLLKKLTGDFKAFSVEGQGLDVWEYLGGPWRHIQTCAFLRERTDGESHR